MKKNIIFLLLILICYFIFASYKLDLRVVTDESWISAPAYTLVTAGKMAIPEFKGDPDGRDKMFLGLSPQVIMLAGAFKIFGFSVFSGRLLSIILCMLVIFFTYCIAEYLFNFEVALVSGALIATDNFVFLTSRTIRPDIFVTAFLLISFFIIIKAIDNKSNLSFFLSGLFLGIGMLQHINAVIGLAALLLIFLFEFGAVGFLKKYFWFFVLGIAVIIFPFIIYLIFMIYPDKLNYLLGQYLIKSQTFDSRMFPLFSPDWLFYSFKGEIFKRYTDFIFFPYRVHILVTSAFAIVYSLIYKNRANRMLLVMILTFVIAFWLIIANKNVRYIVIFLPYLSILIAGAIYGIFENSSLYLLRRIAIYFIAFLIISQIGGNILFFYEYRDSGYYALINKIKQIVPKDVSIFGPMTYWIGLNDHEYYAQEGVSFQLAKNIYKAKVYILGSRELVSANAYDPSTIYRTTLRKEMDSHFKSHGKLLGKIQDGFYGDIKIYKNY